MGRGGGGVVYVGVGVQFLLKLENSNEMKGKKDSFVKSRTEQIYKRN